MDAILHVSGSRTCNAQASQQLFRMGAIILPTRRFHGHSLVDWVLHHLCTFSAQLSIRSTKKLVGILGR